LEKTFSPKKLRLNFQTSKIRHVNFLQVPSNFSACWKKLFQKKCLGKNLTIPPHIPRNTIGMEASQPSKQPQAKKAAEPKQPPPPPAPKQAAEPPPRFYVPLTFADFID
jgi:hypothetical protein